MASAHYNKTLTLFLQADLDILVDTIKVRLGRASAYTLSQTDEFLSSLPAAIVTDVTLGSKTVTDGVFDAADAVFASVPAGAAVDRLWIYKDTGSAATSPLIAEIQVTGVTPNGGDITAVWDSGSNKIFKI